MHPVAAPPKEDVPLNLVGGNTFGRNPKISQESTYNLMVSDGALVQTPGYTKLFSTGNGGVGRTIFTSIRGNFMISVVGNGVYKVNGAKGFETEQFLFELDTFFGDVSCDENEAFQIGICDGEGVWIYDWRANTAVKASLPINSQTGVSIVPGYISYHDGYFLVPDKSSSFWYLSAPNDGTSWLWGAGSTAVFGSIQTKADYAQAVLRAPGKGSLIYVFGVKVMEMWYNVGNQIFPYQRNNSISVDYGCLSADTIATMDEYVAYLGVNEKSGPAILISAGGSFTRLSTDGIDYLLSNLKNPGDSYASFTRIQGHVWYVLTFADPEDNVSLIYDFNTKLFYYLTDENTNFFIAENIASFNGTYYFVSLRDDCIYELSPNYYTYNYAPRGTPPGDQEFLIPRMRICQTERQIDSASYVGINASFTIETGVDPYFVASNPIYITGENGLVISGEQEPTYIGPYISGEHVLVDYEPRIDWSISYDSGNSFGNIYPTPLFPQGYGQNRVICWGFGIANAMVIKLQFWSKWRTTAFDGVVQVRARP